MLSKLTLRNIYIKDFYKQFQLYDVPNRSVRIQPNPGEDKYTTIHRILTEELQSQEHMTENAIDEFLYTQLFYSINNWQYVYLNSDITSEIEGKQVNEVSDFLSGIEELKFNSKLTDAIGESDYEICTTRLEKIDNRVQRINILLKVGITEDQDERLNFFCGVSVDIESGLVIMRFCQHLLDQFNLDPMDVIKNVKDMLNGANSYGSFLEKLNLNVIGMNEEKPKKIISELFKELSAEAEEILNRRVGENTEKDIKDFLEGKGLPSKEDYIQQIKSVIFQDIASECADTLFVNGWVFRFVFREGKLTKASSRTDDKSPIYGSKVYWHLKELIFKSEEMQEAGFHWYITSPEEVEEPSFVQVRLESRHDSLLVHYYYKMRTHDRKEKEDYVLQKIKNYL